MGTDIEALSINTNWYGVNRDVAEKMIQLENEKLAELVA
jgi:aminocarboxymuconate-semialdehyde decarboxylase